MVCVQESFLCGNVFANSFPTNAYMSILYSVMSQTTVIFVSMWWEPQILLERFTLRDTVSNQTWIWDRDFWVGKNTIQGRLLSESKCWIHRWQMCTERRRNCVVYLMKELSAKRKERKHLEKHISKLWTGYHRHHIYPKLSVNLKFWRLEYEEKSCFTHAKLFLV
jgi:hypothetical protein